MSRKWRRGLAPLELVLWMPILLFVMGLSVNLGTMQTWRERGDVVARDAIWRTRSPRDGSSEPRPDLAIWPAYYGNSAVATLGTSGGDEIRPLDHPAIDQEVVRGGPAPNYFDATSILWMEYGTAGGWSQIRRPFPLFGAWQPYESGQIWHPLYVQKLQARQIGLGSNEALRSPLQYDFPDNFPNHPAEFFSAINDIVSIPHYQDLDVLDRDIDVEKYVGGHDFYPRLQKNCSLDGEDFHLDELGPTPPDFSTSVEPNTIFIDLEETSFCVLKEDGDQAPNPAKPASEGANNDGTRDGDRPKSSPPGEGREDGRDSDGDREDGDDRREDGRDDDDDDDDDEDGDDDDDDDDGDGDKREGRREREGDKDGHHLEDVSALPWEMTNFFTNMYNREIRRLKQENEALNMLLQTPEGAQNAGEIRAKIQANEREIKELQEKLEQVKAFEALLPDLEDFLEEEEKREGVVDNDGDNRDERQVEGRGDQR